MEISAPVSSRIVDRFFLAVSTTCVQIDAHCSLEAPRRSPPGNLRVGQLGRGSQALHALRSLDAISEVLRRFAVETAGVPAVEQLAVDGHLPQGFLQIVAGGIGELLQIRIGAPQFLIGSPASKSSSCSLRPVMSSQMKLKRGYPAGPMPRKLTLTLSHFAPARVDCSYSNWTRGARPRPAGTLRKYQRSFDLVGRPRP